MSCDLGYTGLRSISLKPEGRFLNENFTVKTNDPVVIEKLVSCCTTSVEVTAVDVRGNKVTCRPDQCKLNSSAYLRNSRILFK